MCVCVCVFACDDCFHYYIIRKEYVIFYCVACASVCIHIAWIRRYTIFHAHWVCALHVHKSINVKETNEKKSGAKCFTHRLTKREKKGDDDKWNASYNWHRKQKQYNIPFDLYAHFQRWLVVYRLTMVFFCSLFFIFFVANSFIFCSHHVHTTCVVLKMTSPPNEMSSNRFYNLHTFHKHTRCVDL